MGNNDTKGKSRFRLLFISLVLLCAVIMFIFLHYHLLNDTDSKFKIPNYTVSQVQLKYSGPNNQTRFVSKVQYNDTTSVDVYVNVSNNCSLLSSDSASKLSTLVTVETDYELLEWSNNLQEKLFCRKPNYLVYYLYHVRKAAGTTMRLILIESAARARINSYETEGKTLDQNLLRSNMVLTVTTLRDPIERILSLYWYEHVAWYVNVLNKKQLCKPLKLWVDAWRDGSEYKTNILRELPTNNYVEIENYYVKMLIGWQYLQHNITRQHLQEAKNILRSFDVVLIMEWMRNMSHVNAMEKIFETNLPPRNKGIPVATLLSSKKMEGDVEIRNKFKEKFMNDELSVIAELRSMNRFDLELYEYAKLLVERRMECVASENFSFALDPEKHFCQMGSISHIRKFRSSFGVFQPSGHKGP